MNSFSNLPTNSRIFSTILAPMKIALHLHFCGGNLILRLNTEAGDPKYNTRKKNKTIKLTINDCGTKSTIYIKTSAAKSFLELISKTSIPILAPCPSILDITSYTLTLQTVTGKAHFEWNEFCDPAWLPLFNIVNKFMRLGRRAIGGKAFIYDAVMGS